MSRRYLVGVDSGGTKIDVLVADQNGRVLSFARGLGGIPRRIGHSEYLNRLLAIIRVGLDDAVRGEAGRIEFELGVGLAGYDWLSQKAELEALVASIPGCSELRLVNDTTLALIAGIESGHGICVSAGTGCNCRGIDFDGTEHRVIGTGYMFAEYGSAISISAKAVEAIGHEWIGRGPATTLSRELVSQSGCSTLDAVIEDISVGKLVIGPEFAVKVIEHANAGDEVAQEILTWAASELSELVSAVAHQFPEGHQPVNVVGAGRLLRESSPLWRMTRAAISNRFPKAHIHALSVPTALGGLMTTTSGTASGFRSRLVKSFREQPTLIRQWQA